MIIKNLPPLYTLKLFVEKFVITNQVLEDALCPLPSSLLSIKVGNESSRTSKEASQWCAQGFTRWGGGV